MTKLYVVVDIGCIECGEGSDVIGIFTSKIKAEKVCEEAEQKQATDWRGEHNFNIFEQNTIDTSES